MRILAAQTRALLGRMNSRAFSIDPDRLRIPDTMIAREAEALSTEVYTQALLNHCLRSYALGTILAQRDGLEHDPELLYVTCLLHDLGVSDRYRDTVAGQSCFAATGATVAREWSRGHGWREPRCTALADAICQHLNHKFDPNTGSKLTSCRLGPASMSSAYATRRWPRPRFRSCSLAIPASDPRNRSAAPCVPKPTSTAAREFTSSFRYMQFGARINRAPYED
jgi:hypothetical protein